MNWVTDAVAEVCPHYIHTLSEEKRGVMELGWNFCPKCGDEL
jgi:hypothetical protein